MLQDVLHRRTQSNLSLLPVEVFPSHTPKLFQKLQGSFVMLLFAVGKLSLIEGLHQCGPIVQRNGTNNCSSCRFISQVIPANIHLLHVLAQTRLQTNDITHIPTEKFCCLSECLSNVANLDCGVWRKPKRYNSSFISGFLY